MDNLKNNILESNTNEIDNKISRGDDIRDADNTNDNKTTKFNNRDNDYSDSLLSNMENYGKIDISSVDKFMTSMDKNIENFLKSSQNIFEDDEIKNKNDKENKYSENIINTNNLNNDHNNGKGKQQMNDQFDIENPNDGNRKRGPEAANLIENDNELKKVRVNINNIIEPVAANGERKRGREAANLIENDNDEPEQARFKVNYPFERIATNSERAAPAAAVIAAPATRVEPVLAAANNTRANPAPAATGVDDRVLVPVGKGITDMMEYQPIDQYKKNRPELTGQALKDDLDQKAILIRSESGTYLTKNQIYRSTPVDSSKDKAGQTAERDETFKKNMDELGLSDKNFAQINQKTPEFERYLDVPGGGKRLKPFNLEHPEQAGQNSPDILLREGDKFNAYWLRKDSTIKTLKDIEDTGSKREDIMLKTTGNSYLPVDTYNARQGNGAAEKQIAKLTETVLNNERPDKDLKAGFYKVDDGVYFSKEKFAAEKPEADRSKTEALFQGPSGHSLVTDKTLKFLDPKGAAEKLAAEGVPNGVKVPMNVNKPDVLVRVDNETLISGERAAILIKGKPLDQVFPASDIYIQNIGKNGKPTGNYADKESFERNNPKGQVYDRLVSAGITEKDQSAVKLAEAFSSINLGRTLNQSSTLKTNQLDDRSRGRDGRG